MFWKLAWRNIWRNSTRTFLSVLIIAIGIAALIFTDGLFMGMTSNVIKNATETFIGQAQVHRKGFRDDYAIEKTIHQLPRVLAQLKQQSQITHLSVRLVVQGILSGAGGTEPVTIYGVDPQAEQSLSKFDEGIIEGNYLTSTDGREIILGRKLREKLELRLGDRLVVSAVEPKNNEMAQELFRLSGIFHLGEKQLDETVVLVPIEMLRKMVGLQGEAHEIALRFDKLDARGQPLFPAKLDDPEPQNELLTWNKLLPSLDVMMQTSDLSMGIIGAILFFIVGLGIMNSLLMGLYERMFEFGVLRSIGNTPRQMLKLIFYETVCLAGISVIGGLILSAMLMTLMGYVGIDYSGIDFGGITFQEKIFPQWTLYQCIKYPLWAVICTLLAAIYPGWVVSRILPVEALRKRKL
ncbi:MAG: ABC transporter permease [SAR324 cluster bacterium]|nr:ABC transporter permease [SAR324 cluster bacterium]